MTSSITIRTESSVAEKISSLAKAMDRSRDWVIKDALKKYISEQEWQIEGIQKGIESLNHGEGISHNLLKERMNEIIAKT